MAVIKGIHAMFYTPAEDELRTFFKDTLRFPYTDTGGGWLIFRAPAAEIGCHRSDRTFHSISFYCDDLLKTMDQLKQRGVEFSAGVTDEEWGRVTRFKLPGGGEAELYEPKYTLGQTRSRPRGRVRTRLRRPARRRVKS